MNNPRELLEMAAKAAGIKGGWVDSYYDDYYYRGNDSGILYELEGGGWDVWNPLTDDGDALRLAVKINEVRLFIYDDHVSMGTLQIVEPHTGDACAATRRAIVRAAAEIGRSMEGKL